MSDRVFIIGAGKVGRGLSRAFRASGVSVVGLHAREPGDEVTSSGPYPASIGDANVIIVAVRDSEIDGVCRALAGLEQEHPGWLAHGAVVLQTSGVVTPPAFALLRPLGIDGGTFHPLVPFATPEHGARLLNDAWIGIDGDANARAAARRLAAALGARTVDIPVNSKVLYHAAAVMASNFPVVLAGIASQLLTDAGVPERTAQHVVHSLMSAAVRNLEHGSPGDVLTGPTVRGDSATIEAHRHVLRERGRAAAGDAVASDALAVYEILGRAAQALRRG